MTNKQILTTLSILALVILAFMIASLLVYPQWLNSPLWWVTLLVVSVPIALEIIKLTTDILKNLKDITPEKQDRQIYRSCSPYEYRQSLAEPKGWSISWVDRGATSPAALKALPSARLLISGRMKAGKTREAIELIQRLIDNETVSPHRIFEPTNWFIQASQQALDDALSEIIDTRHPLVWFVDDLPRFCPGDDQLQSMARWLDKLDQCGNLYVIAAGRSDDLDQYPSLKAWLKKQKFETVLLTDLQQEFALALVDRAAPVYHLLLDDAARQAFAAGMDGRPEHLRLAMSKLQGTEALPVRVDHETAQRVMRDSLLEIWAEQRARAEKMYPFARYLFTSLDAFHSAGFVPWKDLVFDYALSLIPPTSQLLSLSGPLLFRHRCRQFTKTLACLKSLEVNDDNGVLRYNDASVEGRIEKQAARAGIQTFLLHPQESTGKKLSKSDEKRAFTLLFLAVTSPIPEEQIELYSQAINWSEYSFCYTLRGLAYVDLGNPDQALDDCARALELDPGQTQAYLVRAYALTDLGEHRQALESYDRALELDPQDADIWSNRGVALSALGEHRQALASYDRALAIDPQDATTMDNKACAYVLLHDEAQACAWLEQAIQIDQENFALAQTEADFDPIRTGAQFQALLARCSPPPDQPQPSPV